MNPKIEVAGNVLTVRLAATEDSKASDVFPPQVH
jgi:hypothetical protein